MSIVFLDFRAAPGCKNADARHGMCHQCNRCGRFDEGGDLAPDKLEKLQREFRERMNNLTPYEGNPMARAVKARRVKHRIRLADAARQAGLTPTIICEIENGSRLAASMYERTAIERWLGV